MWYRRGESADPFDDDDDDDDIDFGDEDVFDDPLTEDLNEDGMKQIFNDRLPKGIPPELAPKLFEVLRDAFLSGKNPDQVISEVLRGNRGPQKKGRKKR